MIIVPLPVGLIQTNCYIVGCEDITDYLDFLLQPGREEATLDAWLGFMLSDSSPGWDTIDLCNIQESSLVYDSLPRLAQARGLAVESQRQDVCPVVTLPDDYEDYLMSLDGKQRHELRRKRKRADAQGAGDDHRRESQSTHDQDGLGFATRQVAHAQPEG